LALNGLEGADWNRTKVRLARLADGEYFNKIDAYYMKARDLGEYAQRLRDQATVNQSQLMKVQNVVEKVKAASDEARQLSSKRLQT
jgi:membrane-bound lytic murein transglycosylase MltF